MKIITKRADMIGAMPLASGAVKMTFEKRQEPLIGLFLTNDECAHVARMLDEAHGEAAVMRAKEMGGTD